MSRLRFAFVSFILVLSAVSFQLRWPAICPAQSSPKDRVDALYQQYRFFDKQGRYQEALQYAKELVPAGERAFGKDHPNVAIFLNNLAFLYFSLGDYARAEPLYRRALAIREKALGPNHPDVATSLNNLAELYRALGAYARAEPLCRRALAIREKALGPNHPDVATSLDNLAFLYFSLGDYARAEPLYRRALAIWEKALGPDHPHVAASLNNLAELYRALGDYARAEPLYRRALAIREKALGPDHPRVTTSLNNLALLYASRDQFQKALEFSKHAQAIDEKLIDQVMGFTSESRKMAFLATRKWDLYAFLSLVNQHLSQNPSARVDALNVWLKRKGVVLEAQKRFQEALVYSDHPEAVQTFQALSRTRAQLSKLTFSGPGKAGPDAYRKKIADLEKQKENLEARLARISKAFAVRQQVAKADCEKIAGALPNGTAMVEFARIGRFNFKARGKQEKWLPDRYLAFILHAGNGNRVEWIDLGEAERIDTTIAAFKKEISRAGNARFPEAGKLSQRLYHLVFEPLKTGLGPVKTLFISPDGNLNLIPFEVLRTPGGRFLIEDYTFNYLAAGRDILGFGQTRETGQKALIIGDPDFDLEKEKKTDTLRRLHLARAADTRPPRRSMDMRGFHFKRLPGTREEVRAIGKLLGRETAEVYTGPEAVEELLRQKGTPTILHLATHGFFLSDLDLSALADQRGLQTVSMGPRPAGKKARIENPLLRSGIALAGANRALKSRDTEKNDGIVTAEKILGLKLRGTDMVVLSACETGLGEVKAGEGVYGLRRAFLQAGTRSMVMSLWSVPDRETRELMVAFYQNIRTGKMDRCRALRRAILSQINTVKQRHGQPHPFYWGAFVFLGEP